MKEVYLILDNIRSMHNVGAIFRTCDGAGIKQIFLCGITAKPPRIQIDKTALGATNFVPWKYYKSTIRLVNYLKNKGISIVALELTKNSVNYKDYKYQYPLALIVGNEIEGINQKVLDLCDVIIDIPMHGHAKSLNVATSAGIALYNLID